MNSASPEGDSTPPGTAHTARPGASAIETDLRIAEHARPDHFLLHLSDTHLLPAGGRLYGEIDSEQVLRRLVEEFEASGNRPEAMIFTGDLADHGEAEAYDRLRGIIEPAAARLGAELIWCMGNHDDRANFRTRLLDEGPSESPIDRVYNVNGLRIITIDTTVPGRHYGELSSAQLDWLAAELSSPAPHGTILAMHHPPVPSVLDLAVLVELRGQSHLAEVLEGSDVRTILAGHLHYSTTAMFAGIPVSVASATCYTQDLTVPVGGTRPQDGAQAFNLVHVYDTTVMHSVVPIGSFTRMRAGYVSPEDSQRRLADAGILIPPAVNAHVDLPESTDTRPLQLIR